jgi:hypothetical protein
LSISGKLSPRQFRQKKFVGMITEVIAATCLPAHLPEDYSDQSRGKGGITDRFGVQTLHF